MDCLLSAGAGASAATALSGSGSGQGGVAAVLEAAVDGRPQALGAALAGAAGASAVGRGRGGGRRGVGADLASGAEVDNVAESGEESEEEWNYYRVEPTGDKETSASQDPDSEDMESQLNPNAAVFIPSSPTENSNHIEQPFNENLTQEEFFNKDSVMSSSFIAHEPVSGLETSPIDTVNGKDEVWLSSSPKKGGVPLDNVHVPPEEEFDREVSQRPGDLDVENHLNAVNGESLVIGSLENGQKILEDDLCVADKDIQEALITVESNNPFIVESPKAESDLKQSGELPVPEMESHMKMIEEDDEVLLAEEPSIIPLGSVPEPSDIAKLAKESFGDVDLLGDMEASNGNAEMPKYDSHSPIVSGASDFARDHVAFDQEFLEPPTFDGGVSTSNVSSGPLNEGILYSTSGFDNIMDAPSVNVGFSSPSLDQCSAQSTPFEVNGFDFEPLNGNSTVEDNVALQFEKREEVFAQVDADVNHFEKEVQQCAEIKNDLNKSFTEDTSNFISDSASLVEENQIASSEAEENVSAQFDLRAEATDELCTVQEEPTQPEMVLETQRFSSSPVLDENVGDANVDIPPVESVPQVEVFEGFAHESPVLSPEIPQPLPRSDAFSLDSAEKDMFAAENDSFMDEHKSEPAIKEEPTAPLMEEPEPEVQLDPEPVSVVAQDLVNGSEESTPEDVATCVSPLPVVENVEQISAVQLQLAPEVIEVPESPVSKTPDVMEVPQSAVSSIPDVTEVPQSPVSKPPEVIEISESPMDQNPEVIEISESPMVQNPEVIEISESPMVQTPEVIEIPESPMVQTPEVALEPAVVESVSQPDETTGTSVAAAVGVAAVAAAAGAAAVAVSKADKKPASKGPVAKAKPSPAAKAPVKTTAKPSTPTSTATAPKKSVVPPVPAVRAAPRTTAAPKPKPAEVASKPAAAATRPVPPKPRTTVPAAKPTVEKKPLTNGDAPKPAAAKPLARPAPRPQTAPAKTSTKPAAPVGVAATKAPTAAPATTRAPPIRKPPTTTVPPKPKPTASTVSDIKPKPAVTARPRPATASSVSSAKPAVSSARAPLSKPIDKQTKETTNKLISATRTTVSRTAASTASKTTLSKTSASSTGTNKIQNKPAPIKKAGPSAGTTKVTAVKKPSDKLKAPLTNGVVKNGHASPEELPVQNGVSHDEPVIDKRESDLKIESLVDNQLVA